MISHFLAIIYFILFGIVWPFYLASRVRGKLWALCMLAPCVAFFFGQYAG